MHVITTSAFKCLLRNFLWYLFKKHLPHEQSYQFLLLWCPLLLHWQQCLKPLCLTVKWKEKKKINVLSSIIQYLIHVHTRIICLKWRIQAEDCSYDKGSGLHFTKELKALFTLLKRFHFNTLLSFFLWPS